MNKQRRGQHFSTRRDNERSQSQQTGSLFCANAQCSEGNRNCDLWSECPLFKSQPIEPSEMKQCKPSQNKNIEAPAVTEDGEQAAVIEYCELNHIIVVHIPNEGKRSQAYGARMQRLGMRKGFPDLFFPTPCGGCHGLFIEMKRDKKSRVTAEQKGWLSYLTLRGYVAIVCHGADEAISGINKYFNL